MLRRAFLIGPLLAVVLFEIWPARQPVPAADFTEAQDAAKEQDARGAPSPSMVHIPVNTVSSIYYEERE